MTDGASPNLDVRATIARLAPGSPLWQSPALLTQTGPREKSPGSLACGDFDGSTMLFRSGTSDVDVLHHSFRNDIFLPAVPHYHLGPADVIIDVGAHIGTFTALAAAKARRGRVFAVEASRDSYALLNANMQVNGLANVQTCHCALSGSKGAARLHHDVVAGNWGHSLTRRFSDAGEQVPTETLPRFMAVNGITRCDFLKMNCEGSEFDILLNTPPDVLQHFGTMLILYHLDLVDGHTEAELTQLLLHAGFTLSLTRVDPNRLRGWIVARHPAPADNEEILRSVAGSEYHAAALLLREGRQQDALEMLGRVLQRNPAHEFALNDLGVIAFTGGDPAQALEIFSTAHRANPGNLNVLQNLRDAAFALGDAAQAFNASLRILEVAPLDPDNLLKLGQICEATRSPGEALACYSQALRADPDHEEARAAAASSLARLSAVSPRSESQGMTDFSQQGEQEIIFQFFAALKVPFAPVVVEAGAYDGYTGSNTRALLEQGWSGILLEPSPATFPHLAERYKGNPRVRCLQIAVSDRENPSATMFLSEGPAETPETERWKYAQMSTLNSGFADWAHDKFEYQYKPTQVNVTTLNALLRTWEVPKNFGYLAIDCEGEDLKVLKGIDLNSYRPMLISVECDENNRPFFAEHLARFGYVEWSHSPSNGFFTCVAPGKTDPFASWDEKIRPVLQPIVERALSELPPGGVLIDVGANTGVFLEEVLRKRSCTVHAFEPVPEYAQRCAARLAGLPDVHVNAAALSDAYGKVTLWKDAGNLGWNTMLGEKKEEHMSPIIARTLCFDDYAEEHGITHIDVIKIDVEGAEFRVLRGMRRTLARLTRKPVILLEIGWGPGGHPHWDEEIEELEWLFRHGYERFDCSVEGTRDVVLVPSAPALVPAEEPLSTAPLTLGIPTRNRKDSLISLLESVQKQSLRPAEVIISDDGTLPDLERDLHAAFPALELRYLKGPGINLPTNRQNILDHASHELVMMCDDDHVLDPRCVEELHRTITLSPSIGIVSAVWPFENAAENLDFAAREHEVEFSVTLSDLTEDTPYLWPNGHRTFGALHAPHRVIEAEFAGGGCLLYRRSAVRTAGDFPAGYSPIAFREDTDMSHRIFLAGYRILVATRAVAYHRPCPTGGCREGDLTEILKERDGLLFLRRLAGWRRAKDLNIVNEMSYA